MAYVYFIRAGKKGPIKIGMARNVARRMATMQTGNAFELNLLASLKCTSRGDAQILEKQIHKRFKSQRIRGEWFQGNIRWNGIKESKNIVMSDLDDEHLESIAHLI